jgi:hypothetical protein
MMAPFQHNAIKTEYAEYLWRLVRILVLSVPSRSLRDQVAAAVAAATNRTF